jgi:hypothetical protein
MEDPADLTAQVRCSAPVHQVIPVHFRPSTRARGAYRSIEVAEWATDRPTPLRAFGGQDRRVGVLPLAGEPRSSYIRQGCQKLCFTEWLL